MKELESLILRIVKPAGNKQSGKFARAENLRRRFAKDIRRMQNDHLRWLTGGPFLAQNNMGMEASVLLRHLGGLSLPLKIRAWTRTREYKAKILKCGTVSFGGDRYQSLSAAGKAAMGRAINGWWFWHYERAPGDWQRLDILRHR